MDRLIELQEEFRAVFSGRSARLLESLLPTFFFLIVNAVFSLEAGIFVALVSAGCFVIYRLVQGGSPVYALGGLGGVVLAAVIARVSGSGTGFFLPGLVSGAVTVFLCTVSVILNRPLVAFTSFLARRWPLGWYWHPKVLPAYNEVTIFWALAFGARLTLEYWLFQQGSVTYLGVIRIIMGWPYTLLLLLVSYFYGQWRLGKLAGPSVEEFKSNKKPPWSGQRRGF